MVTWLNLGTVIPNRSFFLYSSVAYQARLVLPCVFGLANSRHGPTNHQRAPSRYD